MYIFSFVITCLMMLSSRNFQKWQPLKSGLFFVFSLGSTYLLSTNTQLFSIEIVLITILVFMLTKQNTIMSMIISFKYLTFFYIITLIDIILSLTLNMPLFVNHLVYAVFMIIFFLIEDRYNFTEYLYVKFRTSLELIMATYVLLAMLITYEGRDHMLFMDVQFISTASIAILVFVYLFVQTMVVVFYHEKREDLNKLSDLFCAEYQQLVEQQYQALEKVNTLQSDLPLMAQIKSYFEEHQGPIYASNSHLNFILYYTIGSEKNRSYVSTIPDNVIEFDLYLYYLIELLKDITDDFVITTSELEANTLIVELQRSDDHLKKLSQLVTQFKIKKSSAQTRWHKNSFKYLSHLNRVTPTLHLTDGLIIKLSFGGHQ